jgi:hypothetical protein
LVRWLRLFPNGVGEGGRRVTVCIALVTTSPVTPPS